MTKQIDKQGCYCKCVGDFVDVSFKVIEKQLVGGRVIKVYDSVQCSYLKEHKCEYIENNKCMYAEDYIKAK